MNSRIFDIYPRIPLFTTLLLFTITFFVYDDFGIRMILGYAVLMYVTLIYLIFRNNNIRFTRMKLLYLILSMNLTVLILAGKMDASSITFVMSIVLSAVVALIGDIRRREISTAVKILILFSILIAVYVIAVRFRRSVYTVYVMPHISAQSRQANEWLLKDGYGITLGGNVVFIDYILMICGMICFNLIMSYRGKLRFVWLYPGCMAVCVAGMLFVNRKSELLSYLIGLFFCFIMHMGISTWKEKRKTLRIAVILLVLIAAGLVYLAQTGFFVRYLYRYVSFFKKLTYNIGSTEKQLDLTSERSVLWSLAFRLFLEHPILGIGWGHFHDHLPEELNHLDNVHNNYLQLLCETGIVGFLLVMVPLILVFIETVSLIRINKRKTNREPMVMALNIASFGMQVFFLVLGFLDPCIYKMLFWAIFAMAVMMADSSEGALNETLQVS